ncbi:hypothetical protein L5515_017018 [Caenorhabditis briggsae]|uniref:LIM interaction domain-containing protein n=1 Tax=Caenorhabditis briggsae TaxID=6238 RepID=A0AAE9FCN3_CAEBR|nr:hypothetical protein L5515_017018 [Caenorhabditis briggsae]
MPRRKATDGPAQPKPPRSRRKKVVPEEPKPDAFDPMTNYGMEGMDPNMYGHHPEYGYSGYGHPPPFPGPESSNSHYGVPPGPPGNQMMRGQATLPQPIGNGVSPLEFRIHDMNRRLYIFSTTGVAESDQQQWWDAFSHEFFDDECKLWFVIGSESTPFHERERYIVTRQYIPKFFRSIFDSGMKELQYVLRGASRECTLANGHPAYENESVLQITKYDQTSHVEINTEGKLYVEFTPFDEVMNYRIKAWTLELRRSDEYSYNPVTKEFRLETPTAEQENQPRMGFFKPTLNLMTMLKVLEPMQSFMSTAKSSPQLSPREIMKRVMFQQECNRYQRHQQLQHMSQQQQQIMQMPPPEPEKPKPTRKRQRKPAANPRGSKKATAAAQAAAAQAAAASNGVPPAIPNAAPANNPPFSQNPMNPQFSQMSYPDVMVVGEPSMMGSDFGEGDERTISRVENTQYDPNAMQMQSLGQAPTSSMNGRNMAMPPPAMPPPQHHPGRPPPGPPQHMPPHSMGSQMPTSMHNPMHMPPGPMPSHGGMHSMPSSMANPMPPPQMPPQTMSNQMPRNPMPPPMAMPPPQHVMPGQMPGSMPNMMGGGIPPMSMSSQMPNPMQSQMPGGMPMSQMPPPSYTYGGPPSQWPPPANSAMITG